MGSEAIHSITAIFTALVGVAIVAVLVSKNANTSGVINSGFSGFSQALGTAVSPITGGGGLGSFGSYNTGNINLSGF